MKHLLSLVLAIALLITASACNSNKVSGVYAGIQLGIGAMGGGMTRTDIVIYFRDNGTFTDEMEKPGWETDVRGTYTVSGNKVVLQFNGKEKPTEYTINAKGHLEKGNYMLTKMDVTNSVPPGVYEFKSASGSGGIGTASPYVGHFSNTFLHFDGKGNFSTKRNSVVSIIGDGIGGGTTSNNEAEGTYSVKEGKLTLRFKDGKVVTHSFFANKGKGGDGDAMAVIDGRFYFQKDKEELAKMEERSIKKAQKEAALPAATDIYNGLRKSHGGEAIDGIKTILIKGELAQLTTISRIDLANQRYRYEVYHKNRLLGIQQADATAGWRWEAGKGKTNLANDRIAEINHAVHTGLTGLRREHEKNFSAGKVQAMKKGYTVTYEVNGNEVMYTVDEDYNMIADGFKVGSREQTSTYKDYRTVDGIKVPFTEIVSADDKKSTFYIQSYALNVPLQTDWSTPK